MSEHEGLVLDCRVRGRADHEPYTAAKWFEAADAIEELGRQYEVRGEILTAAIERAEKAERERDEAQVHARDHHLEGGCLTCMICEAERDAAVADNAALLEELVRLDAWDDYGPDHPGAALLARMARLEAVAEMGRSCLGLLNEMHFATQGCTAERCTLRTDFCYCRKGLQDALDAAESEAK